MDDQHATRQLQTQYQALLRRRAAEQADAGRLLPVETIADLAEGSGDELARLELLNQVLADPVMRDEYHLLRSLAATRPAAVSPAIGPRRRPVARWRWLAAAAVLVLAATVALQLRPRPAETFRAADAVVELTMPIGGASIPGDRTFRWKALPGAVRYELLVLDAEAEVVLERETADTFVQLPVMPKTAGSWSVTARWADGRRQTSAPQRFEAPK